MFSSTEIPDIQKQNIRKAFTTLKTHATTVANFTLQWQDLEDHFLSIHNSIQSKLHQLHNPTTTPPPPQSQPKQNSPPPRSSSSSPSPLTILDTPLLTGKDLLVFLNSRTKDRVAARGVWDSFREAVREKNSGKIVVDAMRYFYEHEELENVKKICVCLLEEFVKAGVGVVDDDVRGDARKVAAEWKRKVKCVVSFSLEIQGLFLLLIGFGLTGEFEHEVLFGLLESIAHMKNSTELFRGLGLGHKAEEFVQKLIGQNKRLEAIRFIYEFELVDKFPTPPLIKEHFKYIQKTKKANSKKVKNSQKDEILAINSEKSALRATLRIIEKYNIKVPHDPVGTRFKQLIRQKREKNALAKVPCEPRQKIGKKRDSPAPSDQPNEHCKNKRPQTILPVEADGNVAASSASNMTHFSYHPSASLLSVQESQYITPSVRMPSPVPASQYAYSGNASHIYSMPQESLYKPSGKSTAQSGEHFSPSAGVFPFGATSSYYSTYRSQYNHEPYKKHYNHEFIYPGRGTQQLTATPTPGHYNLTSSSRDVSYADSLSGSSLLPTSAPDSRYLSSSLRLYETSSLTTGSDERSGLVRNPYSSGVAPYASATGSLHLSMGASPGMRSYYDRQI